MISQCNPVHKSRTLISSADVPGPPTDLTLKSFTETYIEISWTVPRSYGRPITNYTFTYQALDPVNATIFSFVITTPPLPIHQIFLTSGTLYTFSMFATNAVGDGNVSDSLVAATEWNGKEISVKTQL